MVVLMMVAGLAFAAMSGPGGARAAIVPADETVVVLPIGEDGVTYAGLQDEMEAWGPTALTVDTNGMLWIADAAAHRVVCRTPDGGGCGIVDMAGEVARISDIEVVDGSILVLDMAARPAALLRFGLDGEVLATHRLPEGLQLEDGLSGMSLGEHGEVVIEREGGAWLDEVVSATGETTRVPLEGYRSMGRVIRAFPADMGSAEVMPAVVDVDGLMVELKSEHALGGLRVLGFHPDGSFYVVADEVMVDEAVRVDQTVRHVDLTGRVLGMARVPLAEQVISVPHNLALEPDGGVVALVPTADAVEVRRLVFTSSLEPILPPRPVGRHAEKRVTLGPKATEACVSWSSMITLALSYMLNNHYYSSTNINGSCSGRGKPDYLGSPGNYTSVAYDWGGFDSVSGYNSYMDQGYQAGDTNSAGSESCSRGVDCSGFVSRCWKLTTKYSTRSLPNISYQLSSTSYLADGDIMNKYNSHVVLFTDFGSNGIYAYESTTGSYDRVVKLYRTWSNLSGYVPRRYNNKC